MKLHVSLIIITLSKHMGVSKNRGGPPKSSIFNRVFHYKPSILGVFPLFLETPILVQTQAMSLFVVFWVDLATWLQVKIPATWVFSTFEEAEAAKLPARIIHEKRYMETRKISNDGWCLMIFKGFPLCSCNACFFDLLRFFLKAHFFTPLFTLWQCRFCVDLWAPAPQEQDNVQFPVVIKAASSVRIKPRCSLLSETCRTLMDIRAWVWCKQPIRKSSLRPMGHTSKMFKNHQASYFIHCRMLRW